MDSEGYTKIVGRRTDLINRGGENVYPIEVENVIYTHPDVEEVQVCAWGGGCVRGAGCVVGAWCWVWLLVVVVVGVIVGVIEGVVIGCV